MGEKSSYDQCYNCYKETVLGATPRLCRDCEDSEFMVDEDEKDDFDKSTGI